LEHPVKITFGELRSSGVHEVLIYCRDHRCSHYVEANANSWPDDVRLSASRASAARAAASAAPRSGRFPNARMGTRAPK
jgi:hypothetical protein